MDITGFFEKHGPRPMKVVWGVRELARETTAPEPVILVDCIVQLKGYRDLIYDEFDYWNRYGLKLWLVSEDVGWSIYPTTEDGDYVPPAVLIYLYPDHGWKAALERRRFRQIYTMWLLGHPAVLRIRHHKEGTGQTGLLFDKTGPYGRLNEERTTELMSRLLSPEIALESFHSLATAGRDS